tara:strand:- start:530 stop:1210 length:681 start_codon:yes stop_codon:yes gene_type:complete
VNNLIIIILTIISFSVFSQPFPVPEDKEVSYDVIRKKKTIGSLVSKFIKEDNQIILHSVLDIDVKVLFFPAYKFFQETKETWIDDNFFSIKGFTDFEDDREYNIIGEDTDDFFVANGMDGELKLDKNIYPLNYWNISMLDKKEVFDTQKGIVRKINVEKLNNEKIEVNGENLETEKYIFNATKHPKDKGPFPEYTLWYHNKELIKMEFKNPKDKKIIKIIRNDLGE